MRFVYTSILVLLFLGTCNNVYGQRTDLPQPVTKQVLVLEFDPVIESQGGKRISQIVGASNPQVLASQYIMDLRSASGNFTNYQIVTWNEIDDVPTLKDGFDYTDEQFLACAQNGALCHNPSGTDYNKIITTYDLCGKRNRGEIDEVWMWDVGGMGFYEAVMTGPNAFSTNGPPITNTNCLKQLHIMGFNATRAVGEMLESFGHRVEGTLYFVYGENPRSFPYSHNTEWGKFAIWDKVAPGEAGCGWTHYPHNGISDYDWSNQAYKATTCEDWLNYPNLTGAKETINCSRWNCDGYQFKYMWLAHLPKYTSKYNGKLNNWWYYVIDYEAAKFLEQNYPIPLPSPTILPSPSQLPSVSPSPIYTVAQLKIVITNYKNSNDSSYKPVDGKINIMDAGWVIRWIN